MKTNLLMVVVVTTALFASSFALVPMGACGALTAVELVPSKYTGTDVYVPGETLDVILRGDFGDIFDVIVGSGNTTGLDLKLYDDVPIGDGGTVKISYAIQPTLPDGIYRIDVYDSAGLSLQGRANFQVQGYRFVIETDRAAYLGGDLVSIYWTANNIRDESLALDGVGRIVVYGSEDGKLAEHGFAKAAGSYTYQIPQLIEPDQDFWVSGWFNDTETNPERSQGDVRAFNVSQLGVVIALDSELYAPGGLVMASVRTIATENRDNPSLSDPPEPSCLVELEVGQKVSGQYVVIEAYAKEMTSDSHGRADSVFQLALGLADGTEFRIRVNATKGPHSWSSTETFHVSSSAGLSIVLSLDKTQYTSGDTVMIGTAVSTIGSTASTIYTYVYEVRDANASGSLLARATISQPGFNFTIGNNYEGSLWISVTVDDGRGNKATVYKSLDVKFAVVLVNADVEKYSPGDSVRVRYSVISWMMTSPSIYYVVIDSDGASVSEGNATDGSFTFVVPAAPSETYTFRVMASQDGRLVSGEDTVSQMAGYVILMEFNRNVYSPGETIAIDYRIMALGGTPIPATFTLSYGLSNGPTLTIQTNASEGTLLYLIPETIDEGEQVFWISTGSGGTSAEVVTVIGNPNPLWHTRILDLPLFEIVLFLLFLLCLVLLYRSSRKRTASVPDEEPENAPQARPSSARSRKPASSPANAVTCNSCNGAIEISTSKRPIEVMCPSCGETQIVEK
jgi:predicted RNA-binding Zn-ribbon protein involved in translation (DUF1610 family)